MFGEVACGKNYLRHNVNGKLLNVIRSLYSQTKSCVKSMENVSEFFSCNLGVRQGENLSPLLFAIFLNEVSDFVSHACHGSSTINDLTHEMLDDNKVEIYLPLFLLLYADDTIILAESEHELKAAL